MILYNIDISRKIINEKQTIIDSERKCPLMRIQYILFWKLIYFQMYVVFHCELCSWFTYQNINFSLRKYKLR